MTRAAARCAAILGLTIVILGGAATSVRAACEQQFDSTFALIQSAIFERRGCTSSLCHDGASAMGGLNLTAGTSYDNLVDAEVGSIPPGPRMRRVWPAKKENSLVLNVSQTPGQ
jgi:hypothetical protein